MSAPLVRAVQERLRGAGYVDLPTPFKVAGVEFAFTGAMHGREGRSLDLVLFVDTTTGDFGDRDGARVRQRVEALSRALDVTESRYVVTLILAGAMLSEGVEALSETCRVLQVDGVELDANGKPQNEAVAEKLDDRIRVLLPLTLPTEVADASGNAPAMERLIRALPKGMNKDLVDAIINASEDGEQAVTDAIALEIDRAFQQTDGEEQS